MLTLLFLLLVAVVVLFFRGYNLLQGSSQSVKETASNIDVMLRKKLELTSQLMDVCRGYAEHEKLVLLKVSADQTGAVPDLAAASDRADVAFAYFTQLGERFPELKANASFQQLARQLESLGDQLQQKRERYNGMVSSYNQVRNRVPTVFVARLLGFSEARHLDFGDAASIDVLRSFQTDDGARLEAFLGNLGTQVARGTRAAVGLAQQATTGIRAGADGGMVRRYYYSDSGVRKGPVRAEELSHLLHTGIIQPTSFVLEEGGRAWVAYWELFPLVAGRPEDTVPPPPDGPGAG